MSLLSTSPIITIDFGNTRLKGTLIIPSGEITAIAGEPGRVMPEIERWIKEHSIRYGVAGGSGEINYAWLEEMRLHELTHLLEISADTPIPITINYNRKNLGTDRLEAAVAAAEAGRTRLVIDAGTALTMDVVDGLNYMGGCISPGLSMRFDSLHQQCALLPGITDREMPPLLGNDTDTAIRAGAGRGFLYEISGRYRELLKQYPELDIVVTGGDAAYICRWLDLKKIDYRHDPHLVARGMAVILDYNTTVITDYE